MSDVDAEDIVEGVRALNLTERSDWEVVTDLLGPNTTCEEVTPHAVTLAMGANGKFSINFDAELRTQQHRNDGLKTFTLRIAGTATGHMVDSRAHIDSVVLDLTEE